MKFLDNPYHIECCVTMYKEKMLNSVQNWSQGFSAMCHYTKFGMASWPAPGIFFFDASEFQDTALGY